jgi:hypothetical protein
MLEQKPICMGTVWCNPEPLNCGKPDLSLLPTYIEQESPSLYKEHSLWVSLFAAAFGSSAYPASYVQNYLHPEEPASFINTVPVIQYLEDNNEPNKNWFDEGLGSANPQDETGNTYWYFSPKQFAAMLKADLDGDGGNLLAGPPGDQRKLGIANFSAGLTPVMGGLSGLHGLYYNKLLENGAEGYIPNFHHYCTNLSAAQNNNGLFNNGEFVNFSDILVDYQFGEGVSPESDLLRDKLQWLKAGIGDKNFWLTEFGYDTFGKDITSNLSGVEAPPKGPYDSQKVQAQWLTRGVLEAAYSQAVDRMVLYELSDKAESDTDISLYSHTGLLTASGKTKRSWYYIMTLKSILGEYTFKREITSGTPAGPNSDKFFNIVTQNNNPIRVYEFQYGDEDRYIYAIWSPTEEAVNPFVALLQFPDDPDNHPEYILNGQATVYEIVELSEKGKRTIWNGSPHIVNQNIDISGSIKISETPIFLRINQGAALPANYGPPPHTTGFACNPQACCGSVELSWNPVQIGTRNTLVFYKKKEGGVCPDWDFSSWTLFSNNIGFNKTSVTVTGLEEGEEYCFVIIPISRYGAIPPDNIEEAPVFSCDMPVGNCTGCLIDISPAELAVGIGSDLTLGKLQTITSADGAANTCGMINPADCNSFDPNEGWSEWKDPANFPDANRIYINFSSPKRIKSIYAQDWSGNGDILIQYEDCYCPGYWRNLATLQLEGLGTCTGEQPARYFLKTISTNVVVKELRITKLHADAVVRRLYFCGSNVSCSVNGLVGGSPSDFTADEIRKNSATLRWTAAEYNTLDPNTDLMDGYRLEISQQLDSGGELVDPIEIDIEADPLEYEVRHRLDGLAPATTYYAALRIPPGPNPPCTSLTNPGPPTRIVFTTGSDLNGRSEKTGKEIKTQTNEPYAVKLQPNPAGEHVIVSITAGELETILLMDVNGRVLKKIPAKGTSVSLDLNGVQRGYYWVRTIRSDKTALTVSLIKSR